MDRARAKGRGNAATIAAVLADFGADIGAAMAAMARRINKGDEAMLSASTFLATLAYAMLGIVVFIVSFIVVDKLTPGEMWQEIIEKRNTALAQLAGAVALGISIIIAAAIHG
jgi:putative membrane protein